MFWVFRLGHLVGWKFKYWTKNGIVKVRRSIKEKKNRTRHFGRRSLQIRRVVAVWNRNLIVTRRYIPQDRQHSRWRRRRRKLKHRHIFKRHVLDREVKKRRLLLQQRKYNSSEEVRFKSSEEVPPIKSTMAHSMTLRPIALAAGTVVLSDFWECPDDIEMETDNTW